MDKEFIEFMIKCIEDVLFETETEEEDKNKSRRQHEVEWYAERFNLN